MLKKDYKISTSKEYSFIYKTGKKVPGKYIILILRHNNADFNRFGIVASKKVGNAVKRNRAKRQIREIIKNNNDSWKKGYDIVLIARTSINETSFAMLEKDLIYLVKRARLC